MKQTSINAKFIKLINDKVIKYEPVLILFILTVLVLSLFKQESILIFNTITLSTVGMIYVFSAYKDFSDSEFTQMDTFFHKISGFASAVVLIGFLFSIQDYPNYKNMLSLGGITVLISFTYILVSGKVKTFGVWFLVRLFTLVLIAGGILLEKIL